MLQCSRNVNEVWKVSFSTSAKNRYNLQQQRHTAYSCSLVIENNANCTTTCIKATPIIFCIPLIQQTFTLALEHFFLLRCVLCLSWLCQEFALNALFESIQLSYVGNSGRTIMPKVSVSPHYREWDVNVQRLGCKLLYSCHHTCSFLFDSLIAKHF